MRNLVIILLVVFSTGPLLARGSRVTVSLTNTQIVKGELLSVRDSSLVIATKQYTEYSINPNDRSRIAVIKFQDIDSVTTPGHSWRIWGAGLGYFSGAILGAVVANSPTSTGDASQISEALNRTLIGMAIGSGVGVTAGYVLGDMASVDEATVTPTQPSGFLLLKEHSRYPEGEPEVLQAIQYITSVQ